MARASREGIRRGDGRIRERVRADGSVVWQALWADPLPTGAKRERSKIFTTSRDDAEDHLRSVGRDKRGGRYEAPQSVTVAQAYGDWLERGAADWEPSTRVAYRERFERHIEPAIGGLKLSALTTPRLQQWVDELRRSKLASSTIDGVVTCLKSALKEAVRLGVIPYNPAADVKVPAVKHKSPATWSSGEIAAVLAVAGADEMLHALYALALSTAMRPGEIRGLRWRNVDLTKRVVYVRATMTRDDNNSPVLSEQTKTKQDRAVPIPAACVMALRRWQEAQKRLRADRAVWHEHGFVFTRADGRYLPQTNWQRIHAAIEVIADVTHVTFHGLRHTNATIDLEAGRHPKIVQERLGHRNIQTTIDVYSHLSVDLQRAAAEDLGRLLFGETPEEEGGERGEAI